MSSWEVRAVCDCGETFEAWKGDLFFVRPEYCPSCGNSKSDFEIKTVRWVAPVRSSWRQFWKVIREGYWEVKP